MQRYLILTLLFWLLLPLPALPQWPGGGWAPLQPNMSHPLLRGLQHWWRAVPLSVGGTRLYDLVPGTLDHGTLTNMGYSSTSGWGPSTHLGGYAQINFDGSDDYVVTPVNSGYTTGTLPVGLCLWTLFATGQSGWDTVITDGGSVDKGVTVHMITSQVLEFDVRDSANLAITTRTSATLALQTWYHLCVTYGGTQNLADMHIWLNGVPAALTPIQNDTLGTMPNQAWSLGARSDGGNIQIGSGDSYMVFGRLLTDADVAGLYAQEIRGVPDLLPPVPALGAAPVALSAHGQFFPFFH